MNGKDRMGQSDNSSLRLEKDHPNLLNMRCLFLLVYTRYKKVKSTFKFIYNSETIAIWLFCRQTFFMNYTVG